MGDKKRKLAQNTVDGDGAAVEPEGKKAKHAKSKREDKEEKPESSDVMDIDVVDEQEHKKQEKKRLKEEKKEKRDKNQKKEKKKKDKKHKDNDESGDNEEKASEKQNGVNEQDGEGMLYFVDTQGTKGNSETEAKENKQDKEEKKSKKGKKKEKKEKKAKKDKKEKKGESKSQAEEGTEHANGETNHFSAADADKKTTRFIAFVGNLPFTATVDSVTAHFAKNPPSSVRLATERGHPEKCRGFGFVEFDNYDRMKTCLKLYHHSSFDDGKSPARRINVELTAGGGGKSKARTAKIEHKNQRLEEQRKRAAKQQQEEKAKKADARENGTEDHFAGIHPSRRERMG